jgi:hypothetical protein
MTPPLATDLTPEQIARAARGRQGGPGGPGGAGGGRGPGGQPPAGAPAPGANQPGGRGQQPQTPTETLDQIVQKYVQAVGGQSAWAQAKTLVREGTTTSQMQQTSPIKVQEKVSGEYRIEGQGPQGPTVRVYDGKEGWAVQGGNTRPLEGLQLQQASRLADFGLPVNLQQRYKNLQVRRYVNLDGVNTILVTGERFPDVTEQLYFDRESGLLVRRVIATKTVLGNLSEQVDYTDYRDVSGVKIPFQVRYATWNQLNTQKFTDVKLNAPVEDAAFKR